MSKIREQAKLVRLYQQKYLLTTDLKEEDRNLRGLSPENKNYKQIRNKINYKISSTVNQKLTSQSKDGIMRKSGRFEAHDNERSFQINSQEIDDFQQKLYNSSLPMRIPQLEYQQAEPCSRNILTRINNRSYHKQSPQRFEISLKIPSRNLKSRPQTTKNHSMRNVGNQMFASKEQQSKWLGNFKEFFLKNGKKKAKRPAKSQQTNRKSVSHYLEVNMRIKGLKQGLYKANMTQSLKSAVRTQEIRHTKEQKRVSDQKNEKYQQYSQRSNKVKTISSKPNIKKIIADKRVNNNESQLKPWNYEIEQF